MMHDPKRRDQRMDVETDNPQNVLAAISWALLVTVMLGGYALLRLLTTGDNLTDHEEQFFRAGHGHAGVLAAVGILYSSYLGRTLLGHRRLVRLPRGRAHAVRRDDRPHDGWRGWGRIVGHDDDRARRRGPSGRRALPCLAAVPGASRCVRLAGATSAMKGNDDA